MLLKLAFISFALAIILTNCYKPIIAILGNIYPEKDVNEINHDYVTVTNPRWIHESGGEAMIIHPWYTDQQVDEILSKVNGVFFQGGDRDLTLSARWEQIALRIIKKSIELKAQQEIFPIWGACQGLQLILTLTANEIILENYADYSRLHKTIFNDKTRTAKIHSLFKDTDFYMLEHQDSTIYYHNLGLSVPKFGKYPDLVKSFDITSLGEDDNKKEFINSIEAKDNIPIYAVQHHPEENPYDRHPNNSLEHNTDARKLAQLYSFFFLAEARKSTHRMEEAEKSKYDFFTLYTKGKYDDFNGYEYFFSNKQLNKFEL